MAQIEQRQPLPVQRLPQQLPAPVASTALVPYSGNVFSMPGADKLAGPPGLTAPPNALTLWYAFKRRWLLATVVAVAGAFLAVVAVMEFVPGKFTADVLIKVAPSANYQELGDNQLDLKTFRENQQAIIKSSPVLNAALSKPQVQSIPLVQEQVNPTAWLRAQLKIDYNEGPSIMRVSMSGDDPQELRVILNALAEAFVTDSQESEKARYRSMLDAAKKELKNVQDSLDSKLRDFIEKRKKFNIPDPFQLEKDLTSLDKRDQDTKDALLKKDLEEIGFQAKFKTLQEQKMELPNKEVAAHTLDVYLKDDEYLKKSQLQIAKLAQELHLLPKVYEQPLLGTYLKEYQSQIAALEGAIKKYRQDQAPKARQQELNKIEGLIAETESQLSAAQVQKERLQSELSGVKKEIEKVKSQLAQPEVMSQKKASESDEKASQKLTERIALLNQAVSQGTNISVLQPAEAPQSMDRGKQFKVAGAVGFGVFGLLLIGVTMWEFRSRKINTPDEVATGLGIGLVGTVPNLPARVRQAGAKNPSAGDVRWQSVLMESIDSIRTMLLHAAREEGLQVVMVTSASGGEGKTSLASQLAASLARAWKKTLLIDGDLRNPGAHKLFDAPHEPGFSEVLRGEVQLADAIYPTPMGRLWLMPAGAWDLHAVQALAQDEVKNSFQQLKSEYDFVIVDSCPVLPVADSLLLGQHVDAVVFTVLRDVSRAPSVYAAQQKLNNLGIRCLGAVVIGTEPTPGAYPYLNKGK